MTRTETATWRLIAATRTVLRNVSMWPGTAHPFSARGVWMRGHRKRPVDHYAQFEEMRLALNTVYRALTTKHKPRRKAVQRHV